MPGEIFISYSHTDSGYVRQLAQFLRSNGFTVWTDEGIDIGTQWITVVRGKVDNCAAFVPIMTARADESTWVARELERADAFNRPILPLLLEGQPLSSIGGVQYDDVRGGRMPSRRFLDQLTAIVSGSGTRQVEFDVILESFGAKKIQVIAVVRELAHVGLKEAKDLVESAPQPVLQRVGKDQAERAKAKLQAQGAIVTLK